MPLRWTIDSQGCLFTVIAEGDVSRRDVDACLDAMAGSGAMTYRKLFDGTKGDTSMTPDDLLLVGVRMREFHAQGPMGPLAVVVPAEKGEVVARVLGILAAADRPMRVFQSVKPARRWLDGLPPAVRG
jgi:hypothetical protein